MISNNSQKKSVKNTLPIDLLLGAASIPFTLILTTNPSTIILTPVLVAGFASGLYYETNSSSVRRAGFRTGLLGGLPVVWSSIDFVLSQLSEPFDRLALSVLAGVVWVLFALTITAYVSSLSARVGGWVSRAVMGPVRRDE